MNETADASCLSKNSFLVSLYSCMLDCLTTTSRCSTKYSFLISNCLRVISKARVSMVTGGDAVERLERRAVEAEETISVLQSQLIFLKKAAGIN